MVRPPKPIQISYASFRILGDDGNLDLAELNTLIGYALADKVIDDREKQLLREVFSQVSEERVGPGAWERIQAIRAKHGIDID